MPFQQPPVALAEQDREELCQMSVARTLAPGDVFRARLILMLADGRSYSEIQLRLRTTAPTIARWKKRFVELGVAGLIERRSDTPRATAINPELSERVIAATCRRPPDGSSRWSCRALAKELGLSKDIVHRIWRSEGLRPHRLERFMTAGAKSLHGKAADIAGLFVRPGQHAAVFYTIGNSAVRAAGAATPVMSETQKPECSRRAPQGRLSLYSALSGASGVKPGKTVRPARDECVPFLSKVLGRFQAGLPLTVILDQLSRDETSSLERLLIDRPNTVLRIAPSYFAWLDLMEEWCTTSEFEAASAATLASLNTLTRKILGHIRAYSKSKKAVQWIYPGDPEGFLH